MRHIQIGEQGERERIKETFKEQINSDELQMQEHFRQRPCIFECSAANNLL